MTRADRRPPAARTAIALAAVGLVAASCSNEPAALSDPPKEEAASGVRTDAPAARDDVSVHGKLKPVSDNLGHAITYNQKLAPVNARMQVKSNTANGSTTVELNVEGLLPNRGYAVHAHTDPCGPTGDNAGPHFQHVVDPEATHAIPSDNPKYANPNNEIWLDVTTDGEGNGNTSTRVPFDFTDPGTNTVRAPNSVVVHEAAKTSTAPGEAGKAGGRVACMTVPFRG